MLVLFNKFCLFQPRSGYFSLFEIVKSIPGRAGEMLLRNGAVRRMLAGSTVFGCARRASSL
jgi:uncharacterized protein (DUF779 family)